jgi:tRNA threonylcarbamoyladenosine biosynthesis protein TsaB
VIVLALDTALSATAVAVVAGDEVVARLVEPMERGHQERLAGLVRDAMGEARLAFDRLDRIGVTVGPGSFTGVRVGLAFAKGLALALGIPCVGVGTLAALAASASALNCGRVAAAIDGRRGQVYLQLFADGEALTSPEALSHDDAARRIAASGAERLLFAGAEAIAAFADLKVERVSQADPAAVARLAALAPPPLAPPAPLYLRAPDAKTIAERAAG